MSHSTAVDDEELYNICALDSDNPFTKYDDCTVVEDVEQDALLSQFLDEIDPPDVNDDKLNIGNILEDLLCEVDDDGDGNRGVSCNWKQPLIPEYYNVQKKRPGCIKSRVSAKLSRRSNVGTKLVKSPAPSPTNDSNVSTSPIDLLCYETLGKVRKSSRSLPRAKKCNFATIKIRLSGCGTSLSTVVSKKASGKRTHDKCRHPNASTNTSSHSNSCVIINGISVDLHCYETMSLDNV
tara:strand:- start:3117 stop:3827 length:711 start_codon:yes stop_codon:yes gene_type:complete